ncbi:hypothetical protein KC330_g55 [Hortaea werneckii]|nr:hypothetical protein KC330_g55 [Hortaea werneckii]
MFLACIVPSNSSLKRPPIIMEIQGQAIGVCACALPVRNPPDSSPSSETALRSSHRPSCPTLSSSSLSTVA